MSAPRPRPKTELPLSNNAEVADLVERFEAHTLPLHNWTHRAHLAVAVWYLHRMPLERALPRIRSRIDAYNRKNGNPTGCNETVTVLFLRKIHSEAQQGRLLRRLALSIFFQRTAVVRNYTATMGAARYRRPGFLIFWISSRTGLAAE